MPRSLACTSFVLSFFISSSYGSVTMIFSGSLNVSRLDVVAEALPPSGMWRAPVLVVDASALSRRELSGPVMSIVPVAEMFP